MALEWLACRNYGVTQTVTASRNETFDLITMPDMLSIDPTGFEDQDMRSFKLIRIVGQIYILNSQTPGLDQRVGWRLLPLHYDIDAAIPDTPWLVSDAIMLDEDWANLPRWWGERYYQIEGTGAILEGMHPIDNPFWTHVDLHPNTNLGEDMDGGFDYPFLVVDNTFNLDDIGFVARLRLLCDVRGTNS